MNDNMNNIKKKKLVCKFHDSIFYNFSAIAGTNDLVGCVHWPLQPITCTGPSSQSHALAAAGNHMHWPRQPITCTGPGSQSNALAAAANHMHSRQPITFYLQWRPKRWTNIAPYFLAVFQYLILQSYWQIQRLQI